ncbi:MAG: c-type cytochrome domain-containing protein [Verrucomicrobiota bacterium]
MPRHAAILIALSSLGFAQEKTTYDDHVFALFQQSCLNCHNPDKSKGGLDLSSYAAALKGGSGGKIVEPGDVGSPLIPAVLHTGEKKMPPEGDKLTNEQIGILKRWIEDGLLENKSSSARKPSKPKFETALRSDPVAKPEGPPPMPAHLLLEPPVITSRPASIHAIAASPWAPLLAITGQHQILLHHTETLELLGILPFPEGDPVSLAFTPDARYLIVGGGIPGKSGITVTFDVTTGARLLTVAKEFDSVLAADIRPSFDIVATGGPSRLLKIWNTETGELVKSIKKHTDWITALDLSADGVLIASGDRNGGVWVWESDTASEFHTLRGHQSAITATAFRADSNLLATASEDGTVRFWEMNGGSEVKKTDAHPGGVVAFAFARDGSSVTAGRDMKAKFWKPDFNHARDLAQNLPALPTAVAFDSEGKRAFIADAQGVIRVFQTVDSKAVGEIHANPPTIATRLQNLAEGIASQKQTIATSEKAATPEAVGTCESAKKSLADMESSLKRWTAAAINTRALTTLREAGESALAVDGTQLNFTQASVSISIQSNVLNLKREQREQLSNRLKNNKLEPYLAAELEAILAALDIRIAEEWEVFLKSENAALDLRTAVEQTAPVPHEKRLESISLRESYHKALE